MARLSTKSASVSIVASTSSASAAIPSSGAEYIRVINPTLSDICHVATGGSSVAATTANIAVGPLSSEIFKIGPNDTHVAVIMVAGAAIIPVSRCEG
jgi:hypothetical protein